MSFVRAPTALTTALRGGRRLCARTFSSASTSGSVAPRILVTGSVGQIGSELIPHLRNMFGNESVIASDVRRPPADVAAAFESGPFTYLDVLDAGAISKLIVDNKINKVVHMASMLSAVGEKNPQQAMKVNARGIENVLEAARMHNVTVLSPSTIAVFGPTSPRDATPDATVMRPTTIYGVTKVYLELLGEYYHTKYGVDFRSMRYPGIISNQGMPGGGTTDYAVEIYHEAVKTQKYNCFLREDTMMPMMYMPDCIDALVHLLLAPKEQLSQRVYNVTGLSFTPKDVYLAIKKHIPDFEVEYQPDFRQAIADTWPRSLDDSIARKDWGWNPVYDLDNMTKDMLEVLGEKYKKQK